MRAVIFVIFAVAALACDQVTDPPPREAGAPDASDDIPDASVALDASTDLTSRVKD